MESIPPLLPFAFPLTTTASDATDIAKVKDWLAMGNTKLPPPVPPAEGTCKWILEHPCFQKWMESEEGRLLWVEGLPGERHMIVYAFPFH
jgi:hypothetical protein